MLKDLVLKTRSYRSFDESCPITEQDMRELLDIARCTASAMNRQPLRYRIVTAQKELELMYANTRYAAALSIKLPPEGQRPTGFILMFTDSEVNSPDSAALKDVGIAAQTILLAATEKGFGGCMIGSFDAARLALDFDIPSRYVPRLVLALGKPCEEVQLTKATGTDASQTVYYRDEHNVHFVPKLTMEDILL